MLKIGNYCGFNAGILLGNKDLIENKTIIGDYASFAPDSKAIREVVIGPNILVAPDAFVTKEVPDNVTVSGIPTKVISEKGPWDLTRGIPQSDERLAKNLDKQLMDDMSIIKMFKTLLRNE